MRLAALALLIAALLPGLLFAQSTSSTTTSPSMSQPASSGSSTQTSNGTTQTSNGTTQPSAGQPPSSSTPEPVPYSPDEFPLWTRQLRRAEIITIGAFPIALLVSSIGYQTFRYAQHGYSQAYAPALFGSGATPLSNQEKIGILLGAAGLSVSVALADFIVGKLTKSPNDGKQP